MRNFFSLGIVLILGATFSGCGGIQSDYIPPAIILPEHIKSISVNPIQNKTSETGIGTKLWLAITDEFIRDGRIAYVDDQGKSDAAVVAEVTQFKETVLSYDVSLIPTEYQFWVIMDIKFLDQTNNQYLWEEPFFEQKLRFFAETEPGGQTKEEAKEELWERFANDIVRRTIEGFGTVTSSSPRAVPQERKTVPPPNYPQSNPY